MATLQDGVQVPVLPQATSQYDVHFQDQYSSALRIFFNRLVGAYNALQARNLAATTVAGLPTAGTSLKGVKGFVTDATATTFASVVAGTGANAVPVYCDGTNWRIG